MIPKVIHYCWFGHNPLPSFAIKCIESWKKYLPDYEIKEWNEDNFNVNIIPYTAEAYRAGKYAFVSDYARFWILYQYGGLYFDTDVKIVKNFSFIVKQGAFMGWEKGVYLTGVNPGLGMGADKGSKILKSMLDKYSRMSFSLEYAKPKRKTITEYTMEVLIERGLKKENTIQKVGDFFIYPSDYFGALDVVTKKLHLTQNTYSIHAYAASWNEFTNSSLKRKIRGMLPEWILVLVYKLKHCRK